MEKKRVLLSWSSGKDCAWALHRLRQDPAIEVVGLFTTLNQAFERVAMHGVRKQLLLQQAERVGLPIICIDLPWPCSNEDYARIMEGFIADVLAQGIRHMAFGDLFLEDVRAYRERQLAGTGIEPLFPLWGSKTPELAREMMAAGMKARISALDPKKLDAGLGGHDFDPALLATLPEGVDPCGENGEFHTLAYDGPMFRRPLAIRVGETVERDGFIFTDLLPVTD
ncbi:adenine nucleotide alpha hydrolase [Aeromonas enteropelogenes]|uniref:adenine nucleotide alpha hydrolase n=1 Tax=Aeromonas enteropelogenes TaxID=29489 RepID=UPI000F53D215|nr:adenine nucleotide alpha hydrolase [Aeromonas enteropelogenes]RQM64883.1 adenine nucleotide alpha hydrolase [Aeromonas enteropelogenes]